MKLNSLPKTVIKKKKRVGRGHGSGRVKTAGRGTKGQKARGSIKPMFEGGQLPLTKKLPFSRGKSRNNPLVKTPLIINVKRLNQLPSGTVITNESLIKYGILSKNCQNEPVKILGEGELKVALTVKLPTSQGAKEKIAKAGGKVEVK
ncbi:50S ribosomal protein L15 [Candidatus Gottesmanbacteria bacterium]|nr:50S ribosomal protein L15 [Candidatus Gottesmanbacteria bacterium]